MRTDMASQMSVAAATGQPLLAPAPIQQFMYQPNLGQAYQPMHTMRMYESPHQIQYMQPNPSQAPSPAQPPPQYNPAAAAAAAAAAQGGPQPPPQQYQGAPPPPQGPHQLPPLMYPTIIQAQPHLMPNIPAYLQQGPPHLPVALHPLHPGQGQPHGPNP